MNLERHFLDFLEVVAREGSDAIILHVLMAGIETGRVGFSGGSSVVAGDVSGELLGLIRREINASAFDQFKDQTFEFEISHRGEEHRIIAEVLRPSLQLYIFGAGHVGQSVATIGVLLGYRVFVIDDRKDFLVRERFPDSSVSFIEGKYESVVADLDITKYSAVVIVTRGHQYDEVCLEHVLDSYAGYVGMIGSRRRVLSIFGRLMERGLAKKDIDRVHAPIGLRIGAVTPQEIAVAIVAEIISVFSGSRLQKKREEGV
jgi:xanthine dehydrogenase accessory factor